MVLPFKKILSKLEIPKNDWVLSRFGGCEPPSDPAAAGVDSGLGEEEAPVSQAPTSVAARLFNRWFEGGASDDVAVPPQSCARMSSNASDEDAHDALEFSEFSEEEHKSRAS